MMQLMFEKGEGQMNVKKILFISDHGDPLAKLGGEQAGGQNNYVKQLATYLADRGLAIDVVTHWSDENTPQIEAFGKSCRVIRIAAGRKGFVPKAEIADLLDDFYQEMDGLLHLEDYDIIHSHYWMSGLLGLSVKAAYGLPLVHTSHSLGVAKAKATGVKEKKRIGAERKILRKADAVIATTPTEKKIIKKFAGSKPNVAVIPIGVARTFEEVKYRKPPVDARFVYAGRFTETKGLFTLLEAFRQFLKQDLSAELILAGGDEHAINLNTGHPVLPVLCEAVEGIEDSVTFIGPTAQEELAVLFSKATAVIVPSYYESFGMVAAEAQGCGTPVIASEVGGLQDVVKDEKTGLLVPPEDPKALSEAMTRLAEERRFTEKLGRVAMKREARLYTWPLIARTVQDLYEVIADGENPPSVSDGS